MLYPCFLAPFELYRVAGARSIAYEHQHLSAVDTCSRYSSKFVLCLASRYPHIDVNAPQDLKSVEGFTEGMEKVLHDLRSTVCLLSSTVRVCANLLTPFQEHAGPFLKPVKRSEAPNYDLGSPYTLLLSFPLLISSQ